MLFFFNVFQHALFFFNTLFIYSTCLSSFFLHQFQHAGFSMTIFQRAFSFIEHAFRSCSNFNMLLGFIITIFQHAFFLFLQDAFCFCRSSLNMLDSASPFFN
jgi:hypothetical protein|tara:strand:+ start:372 stop:677 length:306 start_codon:yes stop_codon:yes gene_type:complete